MKILNWGLIGAGDIAQKRVAPALRDSPNCNLLAVSRARFRLAENFAREFGARKWYSDWNELLKDAEIEVVYLATPVYLHREQTIAAAEAGKHVLCEKPMAVSVEECDQMIAACRANNVKLGVAYYRRFYPVVERVKELIASKTIGEISIAQINAFEFFNPTPDHARYWLIEKEKSGGGPMMDFGCHRLEVLTNLFGKARDVKSIVAGAAFEREVEDTAVAALQFESGVCASLSVTHAASEAQDTLDVFGTEGSIHIPVLNRGEMKIKIGSRETFEFHPPDANVHRPLIEDFAAAVLTDREPRVGGQTGKNVAALLEEIYRTKN